jgi:hypothetical protein
MMVADADRDRVGVSVESSSHRPAGALLIALLLVVAAAAGWTAAELHDSGLDPHWSAVGTAAIFAGLFCAIAMVIGVRAVRRKATWVSAALWLSLALFSLIVLDVVAFATRLGG